MIEDHRAGLLWDLFMSCPELAPMMDAIGWRREPATRQAAGEIKGTLPGGSRRARKPVNNYCRTAT